MKIHIVQKGDTLWKLAEKYGVDFEKLKEVNKHLANPDELMPGMKVKIPVSPVKAKKEDAPKKGSKKDALKPLPKKGLPKKDELKGKAKKDLPKADELKKAPKKDVKEEPKKEIPKKEEMKKELPKKEEVKKDVPKKEEVKKAVPKKEEVKKDVPKKEEIKKDVPKKEEVKKEPVKEPKKIPHKVGQLLDKDYDLLKQLLKKVAPQVLKKLLKDEKPEIINEIKIDIQMEQQQAMQHIQQYPVHVEVPKVEKPKKPVTHVEHKPKKVPVEKVKPHTVTPPPKPKAHKYHPDVHKYPCPPYTPIPVPSMSYGGCGQTAYSPYQHAGMHPFGQPGYYPLQPTHPTHMTQPTQHVMWPQTGHQPLGHQQQVPMSHTQSQHRWGQPVISYNNNSAYSPSNQQYYGSTYQSQQGSYDENTSE